MLYKYNTAATIVFPLVKVNTTDLAGSGDYTYAAGDIKISKDGGAAANPTNSPSTLTMGNGTLWTLALTATEMQAKQIVVTIVDAATKAVQDQVIVLETYGDGNGAMDARDFADALLNRDLSAGTDSVARSPRNALRFLRNKWSIGSGVLTVTKEDDTTAAWTSTLATTASADAIIGSDPA
jgi:hypothetical protein